jgi:hypothetical protein
MQRLSTLSVLAYDCEDLSAARLLANAGNDFRWLPEVVSDGTSRAINLHIFAEPWTFRPLETGMESPTAPLPFNVLLSSVGGDRGLTMLPPGNSGGSLFGDIDPGAPIPGLPEPEKLALCDHSQMVRYGMLHNHVHPFDCGQLIVQSTGAITVHPPPSKHAFAILQNKNPKVLADPHGVVIYWGSPAIDPQVDTRVKRLLELDFIKRALREYDVNPPHFAGSAANPDGSKIEMEDSQRVLTTPERSAIAGGLNDLILAGKVPDPRQDPNLLYLIVAAPGARSATTGIRGGHNYFYLEIPGANPGGVRVPVRYAWALQNEIKGVDLTALDNLTWTLSHELLEACTDPEPPSGYVFEGAEICDIAAGLHGKVDGIEVAGYFSHKEGAYKTPGCQASAQSA